VAQGIRRKVKPYFLGLSKIHFGIEMSLSKVHAAMMTSSSYSGLQQMKSCQIAPKNHDGGSSNKEESPSSLISAGGRPDPFALYSSQEIRMDRLLFRTRIAAVLIPSDTGIDNIDTSSSTAMSPAATRRLPREPPRQRVT
jgi:hypothetical protein